MSTFYHTLSRSITARPAAQAVDWARITIEGDCSGEGGAAVSAGIRTGRSMTEHHAVQIARSYFLDDRHVYGCAETAFVVLKGVYGLDEPMDSAAAMALNGGIAYWGGACSAITGAALAVGMLAAQRIDDHRRAKRVARELTARLMDEFRAAHGAIDCRDLTGYDLRAPGSHDAFIAGGAWREGCMNQVEFVVRRMAPLADEATWEATVWALEARPA
jgi:C_GCAxxG_C_C family probable redox protein